ncbi:MAG: prepilin-type N-terminal cleavage/methylation domain-containing protein [Magnetococcus sp. YQC-5]
MKWKSPSHGFTLIEVIFFIVVVGVSMAGITPLYMTVLSNLHTLNDGMQAEYLGWESVEKLKAAYANGSGFAKLTEVNFPSESGINLGGTVLFDRTIEIEGMIPGKTPDPCTGQAYNGELFKCLTVTVKVNGSGEVLFIERMVNSDLQN